MRIKSLGAAAAVALLISGAAFAQAPVVQQPAQTPPAPASEAPVPATPVPPAAMEMQSQTSNAPQATKVVAHRSACQQAIKASEKALGKSQASPEVIASAWQHISTAKQEKGSACKDEAKAAQEML